jgi:hypothetical protein
MKDEALRLALEALKSITWVNSYNDGDYLTCNFKSVEQAITAIKAALEAKDEPVATDWERIAHVQNAKLMAVCDEANGFEKLCEVMDKYEAITPPQRQPVVFPTMLRKMWSGGEVQAWLDENVNKEKKNG